MRKLTLGLTISVLMNILLAGWLVAQYYSDVYFRVYIDQFSAVYSTYLILTAGVGGGSTVGYLFLRRRGPSTRLDIQKAKTLKSSGIFHASPTSSIPQARPVPTAPSSTQVSKHTAYAVPPISKGSSSPSASSQKTAPGPAWTSTAKQLPTKQTSPTPPPTLGSKPSAPRGGLDIVRTPTIPPASDPRRITPASSPTPTPSTMIKPDFTKPPSTAILSPRSEAFQAVRPQQEPPQSQDLEFTKWQPEPSPAIPRSDSSFSSGKSGLEPTSREGQGLNRVPIQGMGDTLPRSQAQQSTSESPVPKWSALDTGSKLGGPGQPGQWVSPVPRQPFNPSSRPSPPGITGPGQRPPLPGMTPRPGQPGPTRPVFPPGQGPPRPLAMPGIMRTQPPQNPRGTFRPGLVVTGPQTFPSKSPVPSQIPGPRPQPSPAQGETKGPPPPFPEKPAFGPSVGARQTPEREEDQTGLPGSSAEGPESQPSGGTEMDWDTALDTILKTLRKDKVGEKPS